MYIYIYIYIYVYIVYYTEKSVLEVSNPKNNDRKVLKRKKEKYRKKT